MAGEEKPSPDEQAALRELEKLQIAIEESRGRRRRANDAFDQFVKSFDDSRRSRQPAPEPPRTPEPPPVLHSPPPVVEPPRAAIETPAPIVEPPSPVVEPPPPVVEALPEPQRIPAALAPRPGAGRYSRLSVVAAVAGLVIVGSIVAWYSRGPAEPAGIETQARPAPAAPPASPAATSGKEAPPPAELRTTRRVWMRVTVDGAKVMEREVEAAARIPLKAASEIVIRAGDAGAVRVLIAGKDQGPLGADGQVATKRFALGRNR